MSDVTLSREEAQYLRGLLANEIDVIGTDRCDQYNVDSESLLERLDAVR